MYHSKKIGVFISHIMGHYQKNVCQGIIDKALEYGYTAEIFTSLDGEDLGDYESGEKSILTIPNYRDFSGIIFASGTYVQPELRERTTRVLREGCACPIVDIAGSDSPFPAVCLENSLPIADLTRHLIEAHGCRRICYLGCSAERFHSDRREALYCRTLEEAGISPGPCDIFACGYTEEEAAGALDAFLSAGGPPDAVVCYNDALALLFMMAVLKKGYRIPEDIAVTGCDCTEEGAGASPALTTVSFPVYELGVRAVEKLLRLIRGEEAQQVTAVPASPIYKNSCGCQSAPADNPLFFVHSLNERICSLEASILSSMRMSAAFQHVTDIDEGMELLEQYVRRIDHCSAFYLCLYSGWDRSHDALLEMTEPQASEENSGEILLKLAVREGRRLPECSFRKTSLLPEHIYKAADSAFIYTPLFFEDRKFGYVALAYEHNHIAYHFQLVHWFMNINQMLQRICGEIHTSQLSGRLEELYAIDPLTGLYNGRGLALHGERLINGASAGRGAILRFHFTFEGSPDDEFALRVVGHALSAAARGTDVCARTGERDFVLLSENLPEKEAGELLQRVRKYLDNYSRLSYGGREIPVSGRYEPL